MTDGPASLLSFRKPTANTNSTDNDDEFDWYTPIAVILRPASAKDIQKQMLETLMEDDDDWMSQQQPPLAAQRRQPSSYYDSYYNRPPYYSSSVWQQPFHDYYYSRPTPESTPWSPFQRSPPPPSQMSGEMDGDDRLREFYDSYELPGRVQGNLLSLARMGLVAIPRKEVNYREDDNENINKINKQGDYFIM